METTFKKGFQEVDRDEFDQVFGKKYMNHFMEEYTPTELRIVDEDEEKMAVYLYGMGRVSEDGYWEIYAVEMDNRDGGIAYMTPRRG